MRVLLLGAHDARLVGSLLAVSRLPMVEEEEQEEAGEEDFLLVFFGFCCTCFPFSICLVICLVCIVLVALGCAAALGRGV